MNSWRDWGIRKRLGEGGQGLTFLVKKAGFNGVHVLKLFKKKDRLDRVRNEVTAGLRLNHPHVLRIVDHDLDGPEPGFVSEFCEKGTLADHAQGLNLLAKLRWFLKICEGVAHAHENKVIHRDIKPENIFIAERGPVVGDFGICHMEDHAQRYTLTNEPVGARMYIAPELEDGRADQVTPAADVYSLGKLLYWLIWGCIFTREKHREGEFFQLQNSNETSDYLIYEILDRTIVRDPAGRIPNAQQLLTPVAAMIDRIENKAHAIGLNVPQPCRYCGVGFYRRVVDPRRQYPQQSYRDVLKDFGLSPSNTSAEFLITSCTHCGNVQLFKLDGLEDPKIWHKQPPSST